MNIDEIAELEPVLKDLVKQAETALRRSREAMDYDTRENMGRARDSIAQVIGAIEAALPALKGEEPDEEAVRLKREGWFQDAFVVKNPGRIADRLMWIDERTSSVCGALHLAREDYKKFAGSMDRSKYDAAKKKMVRLELQRARLEAERGMLRRRLRQLEVDDDY